MGDLTFSAELFTLLQNKITTYMFMNAEHVWTTYLKFTDTTLKVMMNHTLNNNIYINLSLFKWAAVADMWSAFKRTVGDMVQRNNAVDQNDVSKG